jgi:hypothetical protein
MWEICIAIFLGYPTCLQLWNCLDQDLSHGLFVPFLTSSLKRCGVMSTQSLLYVHVESCIALSTVQEWETEEWPMSILNPLYCCFWVYSKWLSVFSRSTVCNLLETETITLQNCYCWYHMCGSVQFEVALIKSNGCWLSTDFSYGTKNWGNAEQHA